MNPFGAYALGMSSTADPDVAAQVGASMYNNALQNQQQYDTKALEMRQKMQEEQLQRQALASFLQQQAGMSPEQAMAASMMPSNTLPSAVNNALGLVQTFDDQGAPTYTRKIEAPGMSGKPAQVKAKDYNYQENQLIDEFTNLSAQASQQADVFDKAITALESGGVNTGANIGAEIMGTRPGIYAQKQYNQENVDAVGNAMAILQSIASRLNTGQGAVSNYERELYKAAAGVDWDKDEKTIATQLKKASEIARFNAKRLEDWNASSSLDPTLSPIDFNARYQSKFTEKKLGEPSAEAPSGDGLTPDEQAELDALRKKYGR